jgi:DNA repair exonuclease SbcCD ATPase subunit
MIKSVSLKNFQSWSELEFEVTKGVTLIKGYNHDDNTSEGAGKSAILNSICWCLFGQIPKDTKIDDVVKQGEKNCNVTVYLNDGSSITRTRKPNHFFITQSNGQETRGKDMKETQKIAEKHLGFTYETFLQSVYFAQNSLVKFLLLNEEGKARILSHIANCDVFDSAKKKAHEQAREAVLKLNIDSNKLDDMNNTIKLIREQINSFREMRIKFDNERLKTIGGLELKKEDLMVQVNAMGFIPVLSDDYFLKKDNLKKTLDEYRDIAAELKGQLANQAEKQMRRNSLEKEIRDVKEELRHIEETDESHTCDACGSVLQSESKSLYLQRKIAYIQEKTKELQQLKFVPTKKIEDELEHYTKCISDLEKDYGAVDAIETEAKYLKEKLAILTEQIKSVDNELEVQKNKDFPDINKRIELLQTSQFQHETQRDKLGVVVKDLSDRKVMYETLKDGFKEVKSLSFQSALDELNQQTNYYLNEIFEQNVHIQFTNIGENGEVSKIKTHLTIDGKQMNLGLFSGGQTRRIMLAVDLAISDIIHSRSGKTDKLLILDEYFKDLSEESMQKICQLLTNFDGSVILIEHNAIVNSLATNVFEIEYRHGESATKN